jgi:hypothetical protein
MHDPVPPARVRKRDGRVVDFDADRISRALFAATEGVGRPDAFLARELADSVVHFLARESDGESIATEQIAEVVVKVVRELGQPALAAAFEEYDRRRSRRPVEAQSEESESVSLAQYLAECTRRYTWQSVYTRDLAAAQESGLIALTDLETPNELAGCVLGPPLSLDGDLAAALEQARRFVGRLIAIDGLEHLAVQSGRSPTELAGAVAAGVRRTALSVVVNLNSSTPPSWAGPLARGPLFAAPPDEPERLERLTRELLDELLAREIAGLRIDWHLDESSFSANRQERLLDVAARAVAGGNIGFVFDRPRQPVALAEGLNRKHAATLLAVGLNLPALARQGGMLAEADRFLQRLGSLVRLALSAAVQKRKYLHDQERRRAAGVPALTSGFLLDRARFVVVPVGLDEVVNLFTTWGLSNGGDSLELGRRIVQRLLEVLEQSGRQAQMSSCLEGPWTFGLAGLPTSRDQVAGLTPWDSSSALRSQLRAGGVLHGLAQHGTLALHLPSDEPASAQQVVEMLRAAWRQTDVVRLRIFGTAVIPNTQG